MIRSRLLLSLLCLLVLPSGVFAQAVESVGSRALGMGGAFVAVANDHSATWWNPAGLAAGPFLDVGLSHAAGEAGDDLPAGRSGTWSVALATPPFGVSYYRLRITDIRQIGSIGSGEGGRQEEGAGAEVRSLSVSQFGATILHTIVSGLHVGSTLKYVRGTALGFDRAGIPASSDVSDLLDQGEALEGGDTEHAFDLDAGVLAVLGSIRLGGVVRNVRKGGFDGFELPRQVRVGAAYDGDAVGMMPLVVAADVDVAAYETGLGRRRVVAAGAEYWVRRGLFAVRGGARVNTAGLQEKTISGGASWAPRAGLYVDGHVGGGSDGQFGWGLAARVSF